MADKLIRVSPINRVALTFDLELSFDKEGLFQERYTRYLDRLSEIEARRDGYIKLAMFSDALAVFLAFGKTIPLPWLGIQLTGLPAALELVTLFGSLAFYFVASSMITWQGYSSIVMALNRKTADPSFIDPDFILAADRQFDFMLKVFRPKFNIWAPDAFTPGRGFRVLSAVFVWILIVLISCFLLIHLAAIGLSLRATYMSQMLGIAFYPYALLIIVANTVGTVLICIPSKNFDFFYQGDDPSPALPPEDPTSGAEAAGIGG